MFAFRLKLLLRATGHLVAFGYVFPGSLVHSIIGSAKRIYGI